MKLTNYIRDAYIDRAMQDVPKAKDFENIITDAVRAAFVAKLPEFAHYLPAEDAPAGRSLPVVANLVTDFVKAGWPKDKKVTKK